MEDLVQNMKVVLASALSLYLSTHVAHWNVQGPSFYDLHKLFEDQYQDIWQSLDDLAEHLRTLDALAPQSYAGFGSLSQIVSLPEAEMSSGDYLAFLQKANEIMVELLNRAIKSAEAENQQGLMNFLAGRIEQHQKHRWMLRASLKK